MTESTRGSRIPLLILGVVAIALMAIGALVPRHADPDWFFGIDRYGDLPLAVLIAASALLLAVLVLPGPARGLARAAARLGLIPAPVGTALVVAGAGAAFYLLPNYHATGDAWKVLHFAVVGKIYPSNALTDYVYAAATRLLGLDPLVALQLVSVLAGMVYAAAAVAIGRECFPPGARRAGLTALLLTTGTVAVFFGKIEVYAPVVAALSLYLWFGIRWLHGKGRGIAAPLVLGVAFALHGLAGLLLPSLLLLANRGRWFPWAIRRMAKFGLLFLMPVVVVFLFLWFGTWQGDPPEAGSARTGTFFGVQDRAPLLPLSLSPDEPRRRYAILDAEHAVGVVNLLLLVAMPAVLLLGAAGRRRSREEHDPGPALRFVGIAALFLVLFPLLWNISYEMRTDWDLFGSVGVPLALLSGLLFFSRRRTGGEDAVRVAALSLFCLLPVVVSNHSSTRHRVEFGKIACGAYQVAVPILIATDAVDAVLDSPGHDLPRPPDCGPRAWREELEGIARRILAEVKVVHPAGIGRSLDVIRPVMEEEIERAGEPLGLFPDVPLVADILLDMVKGEVARCRAEEHPEPPPVYMAGLVAGRALTIREFREAVHAGPSDAVLDLFVLDVADASMARCGAWEPVESALDESAIRLRAERAFAARFAGAGLDGGRWAERLTGAIVEVTGDADPGRRYRESLAAGAKWEGWWRAMCPAGEPEALSRAEEDLRAGRQARIALHASHWLEKAPDDPRWLDLLGGAYLATGRPVRGRELLRRAMEADPFALRPRIRLANDLIARDDFDGAERILARGLRLSGLRPWAPSVMYQLAWLRSRKGKIENARRLLELTLGILARMPPTQDVAALKSRVVALGERLKAR